MSNLRDLPQPTICHKDLMLATPGTLFSAPGWIFELKYDGFRCLASKWGDVIRLESRNGRDMSGCFPELVEAMRAVEHSFVCDGELVVLDEQGRPQWERLKRRHVLRHPARIRQAAAEEPACIFAFDLLWLDGEDYRARALLDRKWALYEVLGQRGRVRHAGHFADSSAELWQMAVELELEGIVAKDAGSIYTAGRATRWLKIKTDVGAERERQRRPS
ncbi:MAG: ATP-dependent DNA ligase [Burkholderiales bacterium]